METAPQSAAKPNWNKKRVGLYLVLIATLLLAGAGTYWYTISSNPTPTITPKSMPAATTRIQSSLMATGFSKPTAIVSTGKLGDRRLFVVNQDGYISVVNHDGSIASQPFLDIHSHVLSDGEMGLLGLAFSPHYTKDGYFFVDYIDKDQNTVLARYHVSTNANLADPASGQTLLTLKQPYVNHNGGDLVFGPDDYLYVTLGDGGGAGDPQNRAQDLTVLFGKILRLDVSQVPYKIPPDNPFVSEAGAAKEIWDYGLRNPWKISFDRQTHELYIADVGQDTREEVDVEAAHSKGGNNYGWRCYEGDEPYNTLGCMAKPAYVQPVSTYDHNDGGCSITGGYVYRGQKLPGLAGTYVFSDSCSGDIYGLSRQGNTWPVRTLQATPYSVTTFGEDNRGELYFADYNTGSLYKLTAAY